MNWTLKLAIVVAGVSPTASVVGLAVYSASVAITALLFVEGATTAVVVGVSTSDTGAGCVVSSAVPGLEEGA